MKPVPEIPITNSDQGLRFIQNRSLTDLLFERIRYDSISSNN